MFEVFIIWRSIPVIYKEKKEVKKNKNKKGGFLKQEYRILQIIAASTQVLYHLEISYDCGYPSCSVSQFNFEATLS